jgi:hypothetical protein
MTGMGTPNGKESAPTSGDVHCESLSVKGFRALLLLVLVTGKTLEHL